MPRYVVDVRYNGTNYAGWQIQDNIVTVQSEVDAALTKVLRARSSPTARAAPIPASMRCNCRRILTLRVRFPGILCSG